MGNLDFLKLVFAVDCPILNLREIKAISPVDVATCVPVYRFFGDQMTCDPARVRACLAQKLGNVHEIYRDARDLGWHGICYIHEGTGMTNEDVKLIEESFALVVPISEQAAEIFYGRLFEIAPETKALFKNDMKEQGRKLMATLGVVVASLNKLEAVLPTVEDLGKKHVGYGVKASQYDDVGAALLWTLKAGLQEKFTERHHLAWAKAYAILSQVMIGAGEGGRATVKAG